MDHTNFQFKPSFNETHFRTMLFEKKDFEMSKYGSNADTQSSRVGAETGSHETPPTVRKDPVTPMAPRKPKKQCKPVNLKPKKLVYSDDDAVDGYELESGIFSSFLQSTNASLRPRDANTRDSRYARTANCKTATAVKNVALGSKLAKKELRSRDKENVGSVVTISEKRGKNKSSIVRTDSSLDFDPEATTLSQCDASAHWRKTLQWLQPRRDVGLFIECCRKSCKKWRYTEAYHDPVDVPTIWYCEMNSDKSVASCNIPEKRVSLTIQKDLIENEYNAGSIVWVRLYGFPWWPAMVDDSPETYTYYNLPRNSLKPTMYSVTFFNELKLEYAWIHRKSMKPFKNHKYSEIVTKTKYSKTEYKESLEKAYEIATCALKLTILERLQRFSYVARYNNHCNDNHNSASWNAVAATATHSPSPTMDMSDEDEVPPTPTRHITLRDYYYTHILKENR